jgi:hypothetical protein
MKMDAPKPQADPEAERRAKEAENERVKTLQEDLADITAMRARRFGARGRGLAGVTPTTS